MVTERCGLIRLIGLIRLSRLDLVDAPSAPTGFNLINLLNRTNLINLLRFRHCVQSPRQGSRQVLQARPRHRRHHRRPVALVTNRPVAGQRLQTAREVPRGSGAVLRHGPGQPLRDLRGRRTHHRRDRDRRGRPRAAGRGGPDARPQRAGRPVRCAPRRRDHRPQGRRAVVAAHEQGDHDGRAGAVDLRGGRPHAAVGAAAARGAGAAGRADLRSAAQRACLPAAGRRGRGRKACARRPSAAATRACRPA